MNFLDHRVTHLQIKTNSLVIIFQIQTNCKAQKLESFVFFIKLLLKNDIIIKLFRNGNKDIYYLGLYQLKLVLLCKNLLINL